MAPTLNPKPGTWNRCFLSQLKKQLIHSTVLDVDVPVFTYQAEGLLFDREVAVFLQVFCRDIRRNHDGKGSVSVADGFFERRQDTPFPGVGQVGMKNEAVHLKIVVFGPHRVCKPVKQCFYPTPPQAASPPRLRSAPKMERLCA